MSSAAALEHLASEEQARPWEVGGSVAVGQTERVTRGRGAEARGAEEQEEAALQRRPRPVLEGFRQMRRPDLIGRSQVSDSACEPERAVVRAR